MRVEGRVARLAELLEQGVYKGMLERSVDLH